MKILFTNDAKDIAGGENYVLYLAEGLRKSGHEISIAPLSNSNLAQVSKEKGFETLEIPYGEKGKEFNAVKTLIEKTKNKNFDIFHSNANYDRTIAAFAGKYLKAKNLTTIHSCMSIQRNVTHWFRNKFLINHFTPVGFSTKKILIEEDKIPEEKISVVHIGIPENKVTFDPVGRTKVRAEFNIKQNEIVFGTLSRLVEFKGHSLLIKAAKILKDKNLNFKILIAGEGELKDTLIQETKENNLKDRIIFAGFRTDIQNVLSSFNVLVQSSKDFGGETFPVSILEALSVGLPVLASKVGDIENMIDDKENGFLLEPENVGQLAEKMEFLISNSEEVEKMKRKSLLIFKDRFTLDKMISGMEKVYDKIL